MAWPQDVTKSDLRIDYYRGSGPGGQHKNKTDSACRITHIPTGIVTSCEEERKQPMNRKKAFLKLADKLVPLMKAAAQPNVEVVGSNVRVRTYHEPRQTVKDDRSGKSYSYSDVLDGKGLGKVIEDVMKSKLGEIN